MRTSLLVALAAVSWSCGPAASRPCTYVITGAVMANEACTSKNTKAMSLTTMSELNWLVALDNDTLNSNITFQLPKPVTATTYTGGTDVPWCVASVIVKNGTSRTATSRPNAGSPAQGSCSITFDTVSGENSGTTSSFTVTGTATARVLNAADGSTADITITF